MDRSPGRKSGDKTGFTERFGAGAGQHVVALIPNPRLKVRPELLNFFGHITRLLGKELIIDSINSFPFHQLVIWSSKTFE